jgi:hypothetical protein
MNENGNKYTLATLKNQRATLTAKSIATRNRRLAPKSKSGTVTPRSSFWTPSYSRT